MNAVFSFSSLFFNLKTSDRKIAGFKSNKMFLNSCVMSVMQSKKFFDKIIIVTDKIGSEIFKSLELPIDILYDDLDDKINEKYKNFWAISKLFAHTYQTEPYVHLDLDLYLWKKLPNIFYAKNIDLIYLYPEKYVSLDLYSQGIYDYIKYGKKGIITDLDKFLIEYNNRNNVALNCAILGGRNVSFIKEYAENILNYLKIYPDDTKHHFGSPVFLEQYCLGVKVLQKKLKTVSFADIYGNRDFNQTDYLTHFISFVKRMEEKELQLQSWIDELYPEYKNKIKYTEGFLKNFTI